MPEGELADQAEASANANFSILTLAYFSKNYKLSRK